MKFDTDRLGPFFTEPEPLLRDRLVAFLERLASSLHEEGADPATFTLLLAGGYGRGEGGIFRPDGNPQLYNDLEFYAITASRSRPVWFDHWMHHWEKAGERDTGIEVEFKWTSRDRLIREGETMFTYDLLCAHQIVYGNADWIDRLPSRLTDAAAIPLHEATRLLFNRGSTHYFARHALEHGTERARSGYVDRLQGKIKLALGDAILAAHGQYHFSCLERGRRLTDLNTPDLPPHFDTVCQWHRIGVEFKLRPTHPALTETERIAHHRELRDVWESVFLWLEGKRLDRCFADLATYAQTPGSLLPHVPVPQVLLLHLRDRLRRGGCLARWTEYPRATLQRVLALLQMGERTPSTRDAAARLLQCPADEAHLHATYRKWWSFYN